MKKNYFAQRVANGVRSVFSWPGVEHVKYLFRQLQAHSRAAEFAQMRELAACPALANLVAQQPRFAYKHLSSYSAASFSRPMRLAAIMHHYQFLATTATAGFVAQLAAQPTIWQESLAGHDFRIALSYPQKAHFEGELSLHFYQDSALLQMLTCVIVPGQLLQFEASSILLLTQVQGTRDAEAIRFSTKALGDITPAALLVMAAYGLAAALDIRYAAGISSREQLGRGRECWFDYNGFWEQFKGQRLAAPFYLLDPEVSERPIEEIKAKYRPRTMRKRAYKHQLRRAVEATVRACYRPAQLATPVAEYCWPA